MQIKDKKLRQRDRNIYRIFCVLLGLSLITIGWGQYTGGSCSSVENRPNLASILRAVCINLGPEWELALLILLALYLFSLAWSAKLADKRFGKKLNKNQIE